MQLSFPYAHVYAQIILFALHTLVVDAMFLLAYKLQICLSVSIHEVLCRCVSLILRRNAVSSICVFSLVCVRFFVWKTFFAASTWFSIHSRHMHLKTLCTQVRTFFPVLRYKTTLRVFSWSSWWLWWSSNGFRVMMHPTWCRLQATTAGSLCIVISKYYKIIYIVCNIRQKKTTRNIVYYYKFKVNYKINWSLVLSLSNEVLHPNICLYHSK